MVQVQALRMSPSLGQASSRLEFILATCKALQSKLWQGVHREAMSGSTGLDGVRQASRPGPAQGQGALDDKGGSKEHCS